MPNLNLNVSQQFEALQAAERKRVAHEARMQNALEALSRFEPSEHKTLRAAGQFVRATAREGLGRDG